MHGGWYSRQQKHLIQSNEIWYAIHDHDIKYKNGI